MGIPGRQPRARTRIWSKPLEWFSKRCIGRSYGNTVRVNDGPRAEKVEWSLGPCWHPRHRRRYCDLSLDIVTMDHQLFPPSLRRSIESASRSTVASLVGSQAPSYARILHPATSDTGVRVKWQEIAQERRVPFNPAMSSWCDTAGVPFGADAIVEDSRVSSPVSGFPSELTGVMIAEVIRNSAPSRMGYVEHRNTRSWEGPNALGSIKLRRFEYTVFGFDDAPEHRIFGRPNPNLWWDNDGEWLCSSDDDLACSFVAGPPDMIARVLKSDHFESAPVGPETLFHEQSSCL